MADENTNTDSTVPNADQPADHSELDQLIAADEAEWEQSKTARSEKGGTSSAKTGERAPQRQTPTVVSAKAAKQSTDAADKAKQASASTPEDETSPPKETQTQTQTDPNPDPKAEVGAGEPDPKQQSPYEKAKARQSASWKKLNEEKAQLALEREALEGERRRFAEERTRTAATPQVAAANGNGAGNGSQFSPAQYEAFARKCDTAADRHEAAGDFEKADEQRELAEAARREAGKAKAAPAAATEQGNGNGHGSGNGNGSDVEATHRRAWATVKADLPDVLVPGSALNGALMDYIRTNGRVLESPDGVYRAVIQVGRNMVAKFEREAMRVPVLEKEKTALQDEIKKLNAELQRVTSLPGGGAMDRGGSGGAKAFADLPAAERERQLEAELHGL